MDGWLRTYNAGWKQNPKTKAKFSQIKIQSKPRRRCLRALFGGQHVLGSQKLWPDWKSSELWWPLQNCARQGIWLYRTLGYLPTHPPKTCLPYLQVYIVRVCVCVRLPFHKSFLQVQEPEHAVRAQHSKIVLLPQFVTQLLSLSLSLSLPLYNYSDSGARSEKAIIFHGKDASQHKSSQP